jgi:hypothetical protein
MSLSPDEADKIIQSTFGAAWGTTTPVAYDNKTFDAEGQNTAWVRLNVQFITGSISALGQVGDRLFRNEGLVFVQVFTPVGGGKSPNTLLATTARNVFRGVQLAGGLWFRNEGITHVGPEGKWYQQNVSAEFIFDEVE